MNNYYDFQPGDEIVSIDKIVRLMTVKNTQTEEIRVIPYHDPEKTEFKDKRVIEAIRRYFKRLQERRQDERGPYVMAKTEANKSLEKKEELTITYRRYLMLMMLYAQFDRKPFSKNGIPMGNKEFEELWGINERNTRKILNKFIEWELIFKKQDEIDKRKVNYTLNEKYFLKGKDEFGESKFVKLFQRKLREVVENIIAIEKQKNKNPKVKKKVNYKDVIGLIHAVLPYFHFQSYYLVSNPDEPITLENESVQDALERNPTVLKHLSKSHIGRILGHKNADRRTIDKYFDILQQSGAVMILTSNNRTRYLVHPDLMFRIDSSGKDEYTKHIRNLFGQHDKNNSGEHNSDKME